MKSVSSLRPRRRVMRTFVRTCALGSRIPSATVFALICAACGGNTVIGETLSGNVPPSVEPAKASASSNSIAAAPLCDSAARGVAVWQANLAEDDPLKPASVATDADGDAFFARHDGETFKVDASGSVVWSRSYGSVVASGASGNVFIAGTFTGTISLGAASLTASNGTDAYVAQLDENGDVVRAMALGATGDATFVSGLAVGGDGNPVVSAQGVGTVKLDGAGKIAWRSDVYGPIAIDSQGNVLVTGGFSGTTTVGASVLPSAGGQDVFLAKFDPNGRVLFAARFGDVGASQHGDAVAVDPSDDILVSGVFDGTIDFGGGTLAVPSGMCPAEEICDVAGFVVKFDPSGKELWSHTRAPVDAIPGLATDSEGRVVLSGSYPGDAPPYRTVLLSELDANGNDLALEGHVTLSLTDAGAGHRLAIDRCNDLLWSVSVPTAPGSNGAANSILAKLAL